MVCDFERGRQWEIRWVEKRLAVGILVFRRLMRVACSRENVEGWWCVIIYVNWKIERVGNSALK